MRQFTKAHEYAEIFSLHEDGIPELGKRIKANGQREPCVLLGEEMLDGRRRERAALYVGVKPKYRQFGSRSTDGDDPLEFVIDLNLSRRHLGAGERDLAAARYATAKDGRPKPARNAQDTETHTNEEAAEKFKTTKSKVRRAKIVIEGGSKKLIKAVQDEKVSLTDATSIAKLPTKAQNVAVDAVLAGKAKTLAEVAFPLCEACQASKCEDCGECKYLAECFAACKKPKQRPQAQDHNIVRDDTGTVVPQHLIGAFSLRPIIKDVAAKFGAAMTAARELDNAPSWKNKCKDPDIDWQKIRQPLKTIRRLLNECLPSLVHDQCGGDGCPGCRQRGFLPKVQPKESA